MPRVRETFALIALVGCGAETTATPVNLPLPVPSTGDTSSPAIANAHAPVAVSFDGCRAAIAERFHPPANWSQPVGIGPKDRSPYAQCKGWIDGTPAPKVSVPPDQCTDARGGWLGIGMAMSSFGLGISDDGLTMARCVDTCTVLQVADGKVLDRSKLVGPIDGSPVTSRPENVALFKKHGLNAGTKTWPIDDAVLDWSIPSAGSGVTWHLRDKKSATDVVIGRIAHADRYVFPRPWMLSTNGRLLVLIADVRRQTQGLEYEDQVVDFPAAVALVYLEAATSDEALRARARAACDKL